MPISQDYIEGLAKQSFIVEYLMNGLFPCQSNIVRLIRSNKKEWDNNDKFEYRMLLSGTNTGGSLNSQVHKQGVGLIKPGSVDIGTFHATYGTVTDGIEVDMMKNLETAQKQAAFEQAFSVDMHCLRMNVAGIFKNFAIHGQFGVLHQLSGAYQDGADWRGGTSPQYNDNTVHDVTLGGGLAIRFCPNTFAAADIGGTGAQRVPFRIKAPINVFQSNFQAGRYLIKTKERAPWGAADVSEMYLILENQPGFLTLLAVGTTVSDWQEGEFLEITGNREVAINSDIFENSWQPNGITVQYGPYAGQYDLFNYTGTLGYTANDNAVVGAMEGLADLLPWYIDPVALDAGIEVRLGLDRPFRDQPSRLRYSTQQAGGFVLQQKNEHIIDAIMRGAFLTKATVPESEVQLWMNPVTRVELGYEEGSTVQVIRKNELPAPIAYQRGISNFALTIGKINIDEVVEDLNLPTDVIIIGPRNDMSYNAWDNSVFEMEQYIQETWGKSKPPAIKDITIPDDLFAKIDLTKRITYGAPTLRDGRMASFQTGNNIRHPQNKMPLSMHEMGALFTEYPYTYTVVKLRKPIFDITTV